MQFTSVIIVLLSILSLCFATLSFDGAASIDGSFGVDFIGYYNETSMVVIYEDQAHSAHITFFDGNSFSFDNEMGIDYTCGIDGGNSGFLLIGEKLYITCSGAWNGIFLVEYDLTLFNITRTLPTNPAIATDIQLITISPDGKYMYTGSEDMRYVVQISMESFSVSNVFKIPPADGQNATPQRIIAENDYIYVSTYTGDFLCYSVATASVYSHVTGLMNLMGSFIVYNNMIYTWYGPQVTIYDNSFNVVKTISATSEIYPYGAIINGHISYWTYANGIMSFDFTTNTATYLPLVVKDKSVGPGFFAINPSNSSEIYLSISVTANSFGAGEIYTLHESF